MLTLIDVLRRTEAWLRERGVESPRLDAELLLGHVLGLERIKLYLAHDRPMSEDELERLRPLVKRRGLREPLAYVLGSRGFHRIDLLVRPGVLIPRPDTETLVDAALEWIGTPAETVYVADVGTGTGAVALALASSLPELRVYATDLSPDAVALAKENAARLDLGGRVAVLRGSFLDPIPEQRPIDWVVSNPPYIRTRDIAELAPEVARFEPHLALDGGRDGLDAYHALIPAARRRARKGLLVEVGYDQAADVQQIMRSAGFVSVRTWKDLAGIERVVGGQQP
jgi:release factor glutamine methyltransferase